MSDVLVLYYSRNGTTEALARAVCEGIDGVPGAAARLRTVPPVSAVCEATGPDVPDAGPPYVNREDLAECDGLCLGSATRFGNMAAPLKYFLDSTVNEWLGGTLAGKPAGVFTSTASLHGGQESTLLTMMVPLLHHGMLIVGVPYTLGELSTTQSGGSPYGATHVTLGRDPSPLTDEERTVARALGRRVAEAALKLA